MSMKDDLFAILDKKGDRYTNRQLAEMIGCTINTACYYRRRWKRQDQESSGQRCARCQMRGWDRNPIIGGLCLWCWSDELGIDVGDLAAEIGWPAMLDLCTVSRERCTYCDAPAYTPGFLQPPMCQRHYEVALLASRLERQGQPITAAGIHRLLIRSRVTLTITPEEIPALLRDIREAR